MTPDPESSLIRIMIVEDHDLTRNGLRALLSVNPQFRVVAEARSGEEALELVGQQQVDVVLMDINLPGIDGIEAATQVRRLQPACHVMMLTASKRRDQVYAALASGAVAYCLKSARMEVIYQAVCAAATGSVFFDAHSAGHLLNSIDQSPALSPLTSRELSILRLIADGRANKEIAAELGVSLSLIKLHIQALLEKLQATDRTQAAVKALRAGLL